MVTTQDLQIAVTNINEPATSITLTPAAAPENSPGSLVGTLSCNDPDVGQALTYFIANVGGAAGPFVLMNGNQVFLAATGTSYNFENPPAVGLQFTATVEDDGRPPMGTTMVIPVAIGDRDDPTLVATWVVGNALSIGQAETPTAVANRQTEAFSDEDATAVFRAFDNKHLRVAVTLPAGSLADQFVVLDAAGAPVTAGTTSLTINGRTFNFTRDSNSTVRFVDFLTPATGTTIADLTELLLRVAYLPDKTNLAQRSNLTLDLSLEGNPVQHRTLILKDVNAAPTMTSVVPLTVKRFEQVVITPALLGLLDDHPDLGLTLSVDYPPANGDLMTGSPRRVLKANDTVPIGWTGSPVTSTMDLVYVPRTSSAETSDACFISVRDRGATPTALASTYRASGFTKLALTITQAAVPSLSPVTVGGTWNEAQSTAVNLVPSTTQLMVSGSAIASGSNMGNWNLFVAYADLYPAQGPSSASEVLLVVPPLDGSLVVAGNSVSVPVAGGATRLIASIDAALTGNGQALLLHLAADATGADVLLLAKALAYRDTSIRIAVASQPRALFLGFINNTDEVGPPIAGVTRAIANTLVTITRIGSDDAPVFVPGPAIAIVTSTREPIHGTSVIIDPDTAALSSLTLLDSGGQPAAGQPPVAQTLVIDTPSGYSLTVPWTIPATATPQVPRSFTLTVVMGGRTLSQLISVVPLTVPDRSFAIISDAPLALVITALGSAPLRRQIRLERNGAVVDAVAGGATFYLIGDVPTGLSLDATSASLVYDLAIMPVGIHRYSLLAAMTVNGQVLSVEQPTVLRVLASPISAAN